MSDMKMGRRNIGAIQNNKIQDTEFASKVLQLNIETLQLGRKGKPKTKEELEERIDSFFALCQRHGLPATVEGLALATDYDRRTLYEIGQGNQKVAFMDTIKKAKDFIATFDGVLAQSNKLNAAIYCFRAKNMYGMKDVQEIKATSDFNADPQNPEEIVQALPDVDNENFVEIVKE